MECIEKFFSHDVGPIAQFIKYAFFGGIATGVNILFFYIFGWRIFPCLEDKDVIAKFVLKTTGIKATPPAEGKRALNAIFCNVIAFFFANAVCYILNRLYVFESGKFNVVLEVLMFFGISAISVFIGTTVQSIFIKKLGMQTTYAFCANLFFSLAINYVMRRFFVFNG